MLSSLHIENIAVIKELDLDFSKGLTVMTGETGAGKSIIIGSVRLLMGARFDKDMIRAGEERASVEGLFTDIDERSCMLLAREGVLPDENGELLVFRSATTEGRSACKINGRAVPLSKLKAVGLLLVGIHGQHDTQSLLDEETHLTLLDRYGECEKQLAGYSAAYSASVALKSQLTQLLKEEEQRGETIKKLKFAVKEIGEAKLKNGEEEELESRKHLVRDAQKLIKQARIVYRGLYKNEKGNSAYDLIEIASTALEQLSEAMPSARDSIRRLTACQLELEEIAKGASALTAVCTDNPTEELNRIEDRLELIKGLKKRYGNTEEAIIQYAENAKEQLEVLVGREHEIKKIREELEISVSKVREEGAILSALRKRAAEQLEKIVNGEVRYLDLEKVIFRVDVEEEFTVPGVPKLTTNGYNKVRFLISANPGEPPKSISSIASGGELSRVMLALKVALADKEATPSLVFDEIDTGISGRTSQKIGMKLREIADYTQVFCITHSAQVAACGHWHYRIFKSEVDGRNRTQVHVLTYEERIEELSRIMGGIQITDIVRASAAELLLEGQNQR